MRSNLVVVADCEILPELHGGAVSPHGTHSGTCICMYCMPSHEEVSFCGVFLFSLGWCYE